MLDRSNDTLKKLVEGDREVIKKLYVNVFPKISAYVLKNKGTVEDAEDIFQKLLMQVIARYKTKIFTIESTIEGFLYVAGTNLWKRELNKKKRKVTNNEIMELVSEEDDFVLAALEQERWELFQEKLNKVSENCKALLKLFFKKTPYKEIVKKLGYKSDNVVRQRIFNCKSQLLKVIKNDTRYNELKEL